MSLDKDANDAVHPPAAISGAEKIIEKKLGKEPKLGTKPIKSVFASIGNNFQNLFAPSLANTVKKNFQQTGKNSFAQKPASQIIGVKTNQNGTANTTPKIATNTERGQCVVTVKHEKKLLGKY